MYRYQGAYNDWEEETGYNDFDLRTYDAQLGRWTGVDPYDEFASGYVGMGNNPGNSVDEDGGSVGYNGINWLGIAGDLTAGQILLSRAINTAVSAVTGGLISSAANGWSWKNFGTGAAWGGGAGLAATYVPWGKIGGAFGEAGSWVGKQFKGFNYSKTILTMEDVISKIMEMKSGESLTGKEVKDLHEKFKSLPITKIVKNVERNKDGFQINFTWLGRTALGLIPGTPEIKDGAKIKANIVDWPKGNYKVWHLSSMDITKMKYKSGNNIREGNLDIYLHNNAYTDKIISENLKVWRIFKGNWFTKGFEK